MTIVMMILILISIMLLPKMDLLAAKFEEIPQDERFFLWPVALHQIQNNFYILGEGLGLEFVVVAAATGNQQNIRLKARLGG